jgi:hypothetical protein
MTETGVKERPILMSSLMVQAILAGRKTMTRRVVKPEPTGFSVLDRVAEGGEGPNDPYAAAVFRWPNGDKQSWGCPYGKPGNRLWVRETFAPRSDVDHTAEPEKARGYCLYRADGSEHPAWGVHWHDFGDRWKPSIFMPRALSRITLEITGVRVERLQDISRIEVESEGIPDYGHEFRDGMTEMELDEWRNRSHVENFAFTWDQINGKTHPWASNSWVWVISFRRLEPGA